MKLAAYIGLALGSILGGVLGSLIDANPFGAWVVFGSSAGAIVGVFIGVKIAKTYL